MSNPKHPSSYPVEFVQLAMLTDTPHSFPIRLPCESLKDAQRLRALWYGYKKAIAEHDPTLATKAAAIQFRIVGTTLVVEHVDNAQIFSALRTALGGVMPPPEPPTIDDAAAPQVDPADELIRKLFG